MSDVIRTSRYVEYTFHFTDGTDQPGNERGTRSFKVPASGENSEIRERALAFRTNYLENYANAKDNSSLIQPASWKDENITEEAYAVNEIGMVIVTTNELAIDPYDE